MAKRYDLGSVIGKITFKYDSSGTDKAKRELRNTGDESDSFAERLDKSSKKSIENLGKVAKYFGIVAASAGGLNTAANLVVGLATEISNLSGLVALLPAGMFAGAAAVGTMVLGLHGFSDALGDMDDLKKFNEDLKNLAPNARGAARTIQRIKPALDQLRLNVQNRLFDGTAGIIRQLAREYVPLLTDKLGGMAGALNQGGRQFASFAENRQTVSDVAEMFDNSRVAVDKLTNAIQPALNALRDVGVVGSQFLPGIADSVSRIAQRFAAWLSNARQTGQLAIWIQNGIHAFQQLMTIIGNLIGIGVKFFSGFSTGGAGLFNTLERLTTQLNLFLGSARGQEVLHQLGQVFGTIASVVQTLLLTALQQLAPVLSTALPPFQQLVSQIGPILINILQTVGPLLQNIAQFWSDNAATINPLLIQLAAAILAFRGISTVVNGAAGFVRTFKGTVDSLKLIGTTLGQVGTFFGTMGTRIGTAFVAVDGWLTRFALRCSDMALSAARTTGQAAASFARGTASMIASIARWIARQAAAFAVSAAQWAAGAARAVASAAVFIARWVAMAAVAVARAAIIAAAWLAANPIALVIAALVALVAVVVTHWNQIVSFIKRAVSAIVNGVRSGFNAVVNWVVTKVRQIIGIISGVIGTMRRVGADLINGLWQGIVGVWNRLTGWIQDAAGKVAGFFKSILRIGSPSKVFMEIGQNITEGLTIGVQDGTRSNVTPAVDAMAGAVTRPIETTAVQTASTVANGPLAGNIAGPSTGLTIQELHLHIAGNLDPTNPVKWRQSMVNIKDGIREVERTYK